MNIVKYGIVSVEGANVTVKNFEAVGPETQNAGKLLCIEALTHAKEQIELHLIQLHAEITADFGTVH